MVALLRQHQVHQGGAGAKRPPPPGFAAAAAAAATVPEAAAAAAVAAGVAVEDAPAGTGAGSGAGMGRTQLPWPASHFAVPPVASTSWAVRRLPLSGGLGAVRDDRETCVSGLQACLSCHAVSGNPRLGPLAVKGALPAASALQVALGCTAPAPSSLHFSAEVVYLASSLKTALLVIRSHAHSLGPPDFDSFSPSLQAPSLAAWSPCGPADSSSPAHS